MKAWEYRNLSLLERVEAQSVVAPSGCVEWSGSKNTDGYGQMKVSGRTVRLHRWVWEQKRGQIPADLCVCHRCDNPACFNIDHLYLGTHDQNMLDKKERGRSKNVPRGAAHPRAMAKITEQQAREIKRRIARGERQCVIANHLDVSRNLVSEINRGKTWCHVG